MKVLAATTSFPNPNSESDGIFIAQWRRSLEALNHQVDIFCPRHSIGKDSDPMFERWGPLLKGNGAPEFLDQANMRRISAICKQTARIYLDSRKLSSAYDLFVGHWLLPWGLLPLKTNPIHLYAHGSDVALLEQMPSYAGRHLSRRIEKRAKGITFVSIDLLNRFETLLGRALRCRHVVAPMGVERCQMSNDYFKSLKVGNHSVFTVATVGRLVPIKGIDSLIRAMSQLSDCRLLIAGDGPERNRLEALARKEGVEARFLGQVTPAQREAILKHSDLFVQPSRIINARQEGCPVSVLEALDAGVPTLVSASGGMKELAQSIGLFTVPPDDIIALRAALQRHIENGAFRSQQVEAAHNQMNQWSWSSVISKHEASLRFTAGEA